ncbi:MAG: crossover junction endodeoxyribonuclease RuvC [Bacillota bacterium]
MLVLGVDPGTAITGYGIVEVRGNSLKTVSYGQIVTSAREPMPQRLHAIYSDLSELIKIYSPETMAVEKLFFNKNTRTALSVGQAVGVTMLAAACASIKVTEYTPLQVKQAVVGYGRAAKPQVQQMVKMLLGLEEIPRPDDIADALALAICHCHAHTLQDLLSRGGKNP